MKYFGFSGLAFPDVRCISDFSEDFEFRICTVELCDLTITQALKGMDKKEFSSKELILSCLDRINKTEDTLNAFITVTKDLALNSAQNADKLRSKGKSLPLLGIPIGIKDIFCTKGIETTAASNILKGFIPPYDATVVMRLKDAGAVIIGKLNHDAFAHGSSGENSDFGHTKNPWNINYVPGGSSSGSGAAVSAGQCLCATATDTAGSIRFPAAFCNMTGMKNTYGRISRYGVIAMASSLDCPGVITKTVKDQALVLQVIAGHDSLDATSLPHDVPHYTKQLEIDVPSLTCGLPKEFYGEGIDKEVQNLVKEAIEQFKHMGIPCKEVSLPHTKYGNSTYYVLCPSEISSNLARYDGIRFPYSNRQGADFWDIYYDTRGIGFGNEAKRRVMLGTYALSSGYYDAYYDKAQRMRTLIKQDFDRVFNDVDILLAPTSPTPPFKLGEKTDNPLQMYLSDVLTAPINLAGVPSLNIPCGFTSVGLPVGMQIIGPQLSEDVLLAVGHTYQKHTQWHEKRCRIQSR